MRSRSHDRTPHAVDASATAPERCNGAHRP
jgi:hypothetical protein